MSSVISPEQLNIIADMTYASNTNLRTQTANESSAAYVMSDDEILHRGEEILKARMKTGNVFSSPNDVKDLLKRKLSHMVREVFM